MIGLVHFLGQNQGMAKQIKVMQSDMNSNSTYEKREQTGVGATEPLIKTLNGLFEYVSMHNKQLNVSFS